MQKSLSEVFVMDYEMDCYVMYECSISKNCWLVADITFDQKKAEKWVSQNKDIRYYLKKSVEVW